jgi:hypothetical protein
MSNLTESELKFIVSELKEMSIRHKEAEEFYLSEDSEESAEEHHDDYKECIRLIGKLTVI